MRQAIQGTVLDASDVVLSRLFQKDHETLAQG
jgi:hypothetical protein